MIAALALLAVGCSGRAPEPVVTEASAPATAPAPAQASAPAAAASASADPEVARRLGPALAARIAAARRQYDTIATADDFAAAWREAETLGDVLGDAVVAESGAEDALEVDGEWLEPHLPGLGSWHLAEGSVLVYEPIPKLWAAKAAGTPEAEDDRFVELMDRAFEQVSSDGWANWQERSWDYGGCSALGKGVILDVLERADRVRAAGSRFADEVAHVRQMALDVILKGDPAFPYCDGSTLEPMSDAALRAEAEAVLARTELSADEAAAIRARIPQLRGEPHKGG